MSINKDRLKRKIVGFNFTSFLFGVLSLISITFAWFAFSNTINNNMEIGISAWTIDIKNKDTTLTNQLDIKLDSFYPGMEAYTDTITIHNKGDLAAKLNYYVVSLRIFDDVIDVSDVQKTFDAISHDYPFTINFNADSTLIKPGQAVEFDVSISWPLDSFDNSKDSEYGLKAYNFKASEAAKKENDPSYEIRKDVELHLDLNVSQLLEDEKNVTDVQFLPGNVVNGNYHIINKNLLRDTKVIALKTPSSVSNSMVYGSVDATKLPSAYSIALLVSGDLFNTVYHIDGVSDRALGYLEYGVRNSDKLKFIAENNGYIVFDANVFNYLDSNTCYWTNTSYGDHKMYAIKRSGNQVIMYGEDVSNRCLVVDSIIVTK